MNELLQARYSYVTYSLNFLSTSFSLRDMHLWTVGSKTLVWLTLFAPGELSSVAAIYWHKKWSHDLRHLKNRIGYAYLPVLFGRAIFRWVLSEYFRAVIAFCQSMDTLNNRFDRFCKYAIPQAAGSKIAWPRATAPCANGFLLEHCRHV